MNRSTATSARCVLAIDPGRAKCGVAVVASGGAVLIREITTPAELCTQVASLIERFGPEALVIGDGTGSAAACCSLDEAKLPIPVERVDERHTSELARARYLAETPARGLCRLVPRSLRAPDAPYDDYVAVILAERWWARQVIIPP